MCLDANAKPPQHLRTIFKRYRHKRGEDVTQDPDVLDTRRLKTLKESAVLGCIPWLSGDEVQLVFQSYMSNWNDQGSIDNPCVVASDEFQNPGPVDAFQVKGLPGLLIFPQLIPIRVQRKMLSNLLHRDLCNPKHLTNVHLHHTIEYPVTDQSFFDISPLDQHLIEPKDFTTHKPMSIAQFLNRKLRWTTLGGQYDWTNKIYPSDEPPHFPPDLARLIRGLFPQTQPEAAIVNLYSPGDSLSLHRDVAEESGEGLISISIGCDGLFVVGLDVQVPNEPENFAVIRLRSGDAVYMADQARFAWHGVPVILSNTCPEELRDWPVDNRATAETQRSSRYEGWQGWMTGKRVNLNVRQMRMSGA